MPAPVKRSSILGIEVVLDSDGILYFRKGQRLGHSRHRATATGIAKGLARGGWILPGEVEAFAKELGAFVEGFNSVVDETPRAQSPWTEVYRPREWGEVVGQPLAVSMLKGMLENGGLGNMCFSGPVGVGKTSVARILVEKSGRFSLTLNASEQRGIEIVRDTILGFMSTHSINGNPKMLILEEADSLTEEAQNALKQPLEQYVKNCAAIFICNDDDKLIPAIKSRCPVVAFNPIPEEDIKATLTRIIHAERLEQHFSTEVIETIARLSGGDLRKAIGITQQALTIPTPTPDTIMKMNGADPNSLN